MVSAGQPSYRLDSRARRNGGGCRNGAIDRDEAIAAVVDYFNGVINKEEAIEVVRVYFAG